MAEISIIIPVFKVEAFIHRCLDSILNQTFTDYELILVDDGTPDNSGKICDEYAEKDKRITVFHTGNGGQATARNLGIEYVINKSKSPFISFVDSDDWLHPKYFEYLYKAATETDSDISCCDFQKIYKGSEPKDIGLYDCTMKSPAVLWKEFNIHSVVPWCKLYKTELFNNLRYPVGVIHEDEYTTFKAIFSCSSIAFVPLELYYYFQNENGTMLKVWSKKNISVIGAYKEQYDYFKKNGYDVFAEEALINHLSAYIKVIENLKKYYPEEKKLLKENRKNLQKALKKYSSEIKLKKRQDRNYFERNAYPVRYQIKYRLKKYISYINKHGG